MGRSQESFNKKEVRKRKEQKRKEKAERKQARREDDKPEGLDDMIAYVDSFGNITDAPPDPDDVKEVKLEDIRIAPPKRDDANDSTPEKTGVVSFYNDSKGFGFIKESNSGMDVFVHINNCLDDIKEGNLVEFLIERGPRGLIANEVRKIKSK
jgi:cold shock CspA family protein